MKLFLSWSKSRSNQIAVLLREWIPSVIQRVEPWMSSEDIDKGQRWGIELSEMLASTSHGLLCVTAENVREPWLSFEAGALAKSVSIARVRPVLFDLSPSDVTGPLAQFQATSLTDKDDVYRLMASLNSGTEKPMADPLLRKSFERAWSELDAAVRGMLHESAEDIVGPLRRPDEKIDEILDLVRDIERRHRSAGWRPATTEPGNIVVDFSEINHRLGAMTYDVQDFNYVSDFLNHLFFNIKDFVPAFTFGTVWQLKDVKRDLVLRSLETGWSKGLDRKIDKRFLVDAGLRPGMILAAQRMDTAGED
ncbi:hypothetical protein M1L60_14400 [Actinoplanes sp. TRM 88003]|uniref:TIR domain-containing protein n=1 Tax=Paractinoplanes aksuensis TaxID=2939490 RepID=A0ABT1DLW5_9ACTN|nr:hypothetical protein [Actinoplanes aksuensis]MCO8271785.1 hypothetical protein [Actinoplanes aksuensis]